MIDYKQAGVDIEAGDELVRWLQETQPKNLPHQERLVSGIGGFASLFRIGFSEMNDPCLVTATDGVGTKLKVATFFNDFTTIGQDLVAMCVNDMVCCGAQPLLFLDYYATGKLKLEDAKPFIASVRQACMDSDCLLIGGETAEMPGVYPEGEFDCAGFSVGVVDREKTIGAHRVSTGDRLIGLASGGFHSNGFSLLRKVFADDMSDWKNELLAPTTLYTRLILELMKSDLVHAAAHITGGGVDNIPRVLPKGTVAELERWEWPAPFQEVQKRSQMSDEQMLKTLNCGLGMALVVPASAVENVKKVCAEWDQRCFDLGEIAEGPQGQKSYRFRG